jgi:site-specific recombinase XerD
LTLENEMRFAGCLAGYAGDSRVSYTTDLRLFADWSPTAGSACSRCGGASLEMFARSVERDGRMRSTLARRLSTLCGFYRY